MNGYYVWSMLFMTAAALTAASYVTGRLMTPKKEQFDAKLYEASQAFAAKMERKRREESWRGRLGAAWRGLAVWLNRTFGLGNGPRREGVDDVGLVLRVAEKVGVSPEDVEPPRGDWGRGSYTDFEEATQFGEEFEENDDDFETTKGLLMKNGVVIAIRKSKRLETHDDGMVDFDGRKI